jgi:hypothetical protein
MLLVLPVSQADLKLATKLAGHMALLGNLGRHKLLVVGAYNTKEEATALKEQLAPLFLSADLFVPDSECEIGWPQSANHLWARTVRYLQSTANKDPWYWFEADNTPIREDWLDAVETEYNQCGKPFLGAIQVTRMLDRRTGEFVKVDGEHVIGTCVYPGDFPKRSPLWSYVRIDDGPNVEPFDVYLRHEMRPQTAVSKLIHNNWRTKNYEIDGDGRIYCDPIDDKSVYGPVPADAAVVHGCKDGTLIEALQK